MTEAVLDAGPLIHLAEIGALDTLAGFSPLYIPDTVWLEVFQYQPEVLADPRLPMQKLIVEEWPPDLLVLSRSLLLDRGELEALCLMQTYPKAIFLTDDAAARLVAEQRGYEAHGTIGVLLRSVRKGYRNKEEVLTLLRQLPNRSSLHIRLSLLQKVVEEMEK